MTEMEKKAMEKGMEAVGDNELDAVAGGIDFSDWIPSQDILMLAASARLWHARVRCGKQVLHLLLFVGFNCRCGRICKSGRIHHGQHKGRHHL